MIQHHHLLVTDKCTIDWCIAKYNVAWALIVDGHQCSDFRGFHAIKDSMAGTQWLMANGLDEMSVHDREILKRLYCLLVTMDL